MDVIPWNRLKSVPQESVEVGMAIVTPVAFQTYREAKDGSVTGIGWAPCTGRVWIVTEIGPDTVRARNESSGEEITGEIRPGQRMLIRI
ncbi:hypothetical protein [Nonomuraea sp. NPDC050786]|uniref:hypothetical protein n=1 Tax=Nonomuraea sp. NPDC050786 TaxID=3154840 RepID=UPI003400E478